MKTNTMTNSMALFVLSSVLFALTTFTVFAEEDADMDMHDDHVMTTTVTVGSDRLATMQTLIKLMQQVVVLLSTRVEMAGGHVHTDTTHHEHADTTSGNTLAVWVEIHSNKTHAHVQEPGKALVTFFLDGLNYTEEEAIVDAIAAKTGLSAHDIEAVITYPSGEVDEYGDSIDGEDGDDHMEHDNAEDTEHEEDEHSDHGDDIDGIHIMADGTVMNGDGTALAGATVTSDGMVKLADGDIVEPEFDLR